LLSVTALAWSIPFAQATDSRVDADESVCARAEEIPAPGEASAAPREAFVEAQKEPEGPDHGRP
jgi:hypothetical protein